MSKDPILDAALSYADLGWYVFPVHRPIIISGILSGCTCENYRHGDHCRVNHPNLYLPPDEKCPNPGKCPRLKWSEQSTIDKSKIRQWWDRDFPGSNVGIDCGKSGLLVFDSDTYKQVGDLSDLLSPEQRKTPTVITGGGGEHLLYDRQGKNYGNSTKNLPPGIDIRGVGGYIVAAPSLHKSGRRYQWEIDYAPNEIPLAPIPATLDEILSSCTTTRKTNSTTITLPTDEAIRRSVWMVQGFLAEAKLDCHPPTDYEQSGQRWIFKVCPFAPADNNHADDGGAYIAVLDDGRVVAGCHHNRCRQQYEPKNLTGWDWLKDSKTIRVRRPILREVTL